MYRERLYEDIEGKEDKVRLGDIGKWYLLVRWILEEIE